jgi:Holliday junction resolvase RusA-like endonuclease
METKIISLELNRLPPSSNCMYRKNKFAIYKSAKLVEFEKYMKNKINDVEDKCISNNAYVSLNVIFYIKGTRKHDLDNLLKALIDSMKGYLFGDDDKIIRINCQKILNQPENKTNIQINRIN